MPRTTDKDEAAQEKRMRTLAAKLKVQVGLGKKQDAEDPGVILQEQVVEELSTDAEVDTTEDSFSDVLESAPTEGLMSREV